MKEIAIRVSNLKKKYQLYAKPIDRLKEAFHPTRRKYHHDFYALNDLSFEIKKGQIIGIIGKNGSGKSTLLKILTGVLSPTDGQVEVNGRVAALLELGAGFNPEQTGMENIFLSGILMGYSKAEMEKQLPSVLEFADIGEFIHQPVKMYSSGMFVRLAFAVAINVNPDILIIDEALSVGDIRFQMKCIRKMKEFFDAGKTVLFVGHDLAAINSFCSHCLWINEGKLIKQGAPKEVTDEYTSFMAYGMVSLSREASEVRKSEWLKTDGFQSFGDREAEIVGLAVTDQAGRILPNLLGGERIHITMRVESRVRLDEPIFGFIVKNRLGAPVFGGNTFVHEVNLEAIDPGKYEFQFSFNFPHLSNGEYLLTVAIANGHQHDHVQKNWIHDCYIFRLSNPKMRYNNGDGLVLEENFTFIRLT